MCKWFPNRFYLVGGKSRIAAIAAVLLMGLSAGCATTATVKQTDRLDSVDRNAKILIMTPDVKYYLLTAGGVPEPHAEWTDAARRNFSASLQAYADENQILIIRMPDQDQLSETEISYQKLYSAVGSSVLSHHFGAIKLPTKQGVFDWTLGSGVSEIGQKYGADYALFSYYRDYQASGGRVAFSFFAALVGVGVGTGGEFGFASLVDLRTGDIIWFNRVGSGTGELREQEQARAAVDALFKDMPLN